jgi:hypothetical protein
VSTEEFMLDEAPRMSFLTGLDVNESCGDGTRLLIQLHCVGTTNESSEGSRDRNPLASCLGRKMSYAIKEGAYV